MKLIKMNDGSCINADNVDYIDQPAPGLARIIFSSGNFLTFSNDPQVLGEEINKAIDGSDFA